MSWSSVVAPAATLTCACPALLVIALDVLSVAGPVMVNDTPILASDVPLLVDSCTTSGDWKFVFTTADWELPEMICSPDTTMLAVTVTVSLAVAQLGGEFLSQS